MHKILLGVLFVSTFGFAATTNWEIDGSHTTAKFKVRHLGISNVYGQVTGAKGTIKADDKDATKLTLEVTLDANTINTNEAKRDAHLKNEDFFDTAKHPNITFKSKKVAKGKGGKLTITGDLTMHGVTKEVALNDVELTNPIKDPWGNSRRGLSATATLDRKEFGIKWNKALDNGGLAVGDTVDINVEAELLQAKDGSKS